MVSVPMSEAQKRAQLKYEKEKTRSVKMKLNLQHDADIIQKLDSVGNKQGYLKRLIRADIEKGSDA